MNFFVLSINYTYNINVYIIRTWNWLEAKCVICVCVCVCVCTHQSSMKHEELNAWVVFFVIGLFVFG